MTAKSLLRALGVLCGVLVGFNSDMQADDDVQAYFAEKVEPILIQRCYKCHGNGKSHGGLNLYTHERVLKGGDSGAAVDLDSPESSLLLDAINYTGYAMPPDGQLPQPEIDILTRWVELGAHIPERTDVRVVIEGIPQVNEETKQHWAFQPVKRPEVPALDSDWPANDIDRFILAQLAAEGLRPNPPADRAKLIRRLTYNLTGLPPTPVQVAEFFADTSPDAYEKLVDRLLASPHYGEHWARYWLDLVRYAESNSFERDNPKPFVWKYRDYVIRSFNDDKPYDQFVREQLAGDELPGAGPEEIIATGYYRLGPWDDEPADPMLAMYDEFDDILTTTSQGFLGLTLNCARCHDHKLDPLPQKDYYRFLAFFRNIRRYGIRDDASVLERSVRDIATPQEQQQHAEELATYEAELQSLRAEVDRVEQAIEPKLVGGEKDDFLNDPARPRIIAKHVGKLISQADFDAYSKTRDRWRTLRDNPPKSGSKALAVTEYGSDAFGTYVLNRGNPQAEGDLVEPGFPLVLSPPEPAISVPRSGESSGRRLALANWIASEDNPLTARVIVNRIWQWHFGRGLVTSPNNFGLQGDLPTHPELLDWLAAEFVANGWSMKTLHKQILMSNTWRISSAAREEALTADPTNDNFWRFDMRRLRAEEIRDSILAVNGTLNVEEMFGPSIYPEIPKAVLAGQSMPGHNWHTSSADESTRRSIYIHVKRSLHVPLLASFDVAETDFTCPVRFVTTQPTQALGLLNSEFSNQQAAIFAKDLQTTAPDSLSTQVRLALERVTQRTATDADVERGLKLITTLQQDHGQTADQALTSFCLLALNLNEFVYLD